MRELDRIAMRFPCPRCRVAAHRWCNTNTGKRATWLHEERVRAVRNIYQAGYAKAEAELFSLGIGSFQARREAWKARQS